MEKVYSKNESKLLLLPSWPSLEFESLFDASGLPSLSYNRKCESKEWSPP